MWWIFNASGEPCFTVENEEILLIIRCLYLLLVVHNYSFLFKREYGIIIMCG